MRSLSRVFSLVLLSACAASGVGSEAQPGSGEAVREERRSPTGRASLVYLEGPEMDRVVLAAGGDSAEVFSWEIGTPLGLEWLSGDLGRVHVPVGGSYHSGAVYAQASSRRVSPLLEDAVAVDAAAGTVATYDIHAFTLRELWSGRELATWAPDDLDLIQLWQECEPKVTLAGRAGRIRYDCGSGAVEREMDWSR